MESGNLTNEWLNDHRSGFFHQCAVGFASLYPELTRIFQGKGAGPSGSQRQNPQHFPNPPKIVTCGGPEERWVPTSVS